MPEQERCLLSATYSLVASLQQIQRRDLIWVGGGADAGWAVIPQKYTHIGPRPGDHCLLQNRSLICHLRTGVGYGDRPILHGRDGAGNDWLVCRGMDKNVAPDRWILLRRFGRLGSGLPDSSVEGATSGTKIERLVTAALVLGEISFDVASNLPGRPDFIIPQKQIAIFTHGCRQHAHGCKYGAWYGRQPTEAEVSHIRSHHQCVTKQLNQLRWDVLTIWECALTGTNALPRAEFLSRLRQSLDGPARTAVISGLVE